MTREEKAKKYDEALEWMRKVYPTLTGADKEDAEHYFPELAESEDEKIRKDVLAFIKREGQHIDRYKWPKWIAWLEKQKESHKSADFIPSNCASDAKCENRWHKVGDFLPDNPREVLCKDEAGNYFIGRYYVGEGWEISNYDDEDKPHHLNPPVSKWIDFPSEKQKEQKPEEWNEEDKHRCKDAIYFLETAKKHYADTSEIELTIEWLKSLQLQAKQEQKPEVKRTGWVARDRDGEICIYEDYPEKDSKGQFWLASGYMSIDQKSFPDLKWEDEPVEVEITIRRK